MPKVNIIIPLYNEEKILKKNIINLQKKFSKFLNKSSWQFILVDNGSTDDTTKIIKSLLSTNIKGQLIFESEPNYGKAIRRGLLFSDSDYVFLCDIEQWDFPFFLWAWINREEYDYFIGSRRSDLTINKSPFIRKLLSWGLNTFINLLFSYMGTDTHGPKFMNLKKIKKVIRQVKSDRGQFDTELVLRLSRYGYKIAEAPIFHKEYRVNKFSIFKKIGWNIFALSKMLTESPANAAIIAPTIITEDIAFVTDISGVCSEGVTLQTT